MVARRTDASHAALRFGLGPRQGDIAAIAGDPQGFVVAQCERTDGGLLEGPDLHGTGHNLARHFQDVRARKEARGPASAGDRAAADILAAAPYRQRVSEAEIGARFARGCSTDDAFTERLVLFWSNHFSVSMRKSPIMGAITGAYEREAIRPFVYRPFVEMLRAVVTHPAMLIYLDNTVSVGPHSPRGLKKRSGLNENLAREILELHTLGVSGGYTQHDVTQLACILTGWSQDGALDPSLNRGSIFHPDRHEPGSFAVLGRVYEGDGPQQLDRVLQDLARHPSTATHIAGKLVRHFVSDNASADLVGTVAGAYLEAAGDLAATSIALTSSDVAWNYPAAKIRSPYLFVLAAHRAFGSSGREGGRLRKDLGILGQPLWYPPSPAGWPDHDEVWLAGDALLERLDFAARFAKTGPDVPVPALAADILADRYDDATREAVTRAESREQALALMLLSPGFQRI
jgi:uncharacterized protein (DUF1800 family)